MKMFIIDLVFSKKIMPLHVQVERFPGVVILTSRMGSNYLDLSRLPYLRSEDTTYIVH